VLATALRPDQQPPATIDVRGGVQAPRATSATRRAASAIWSR
jgi:hypothetical protein